MIILGVIAIYAIVAVLERYKDAHRTTMDSMGQAILWARVLGAEPTVTHTLPEMRIPKSAKHAYKPPPQCKSHPGRYKGCSFVSLPTTTAALVCGFILTFGVRGAAGSSANGARISRALVALGRALYLMEGSCPASSPAFINAWHDLCYLGSPQQMLTVPLQCSGT